MRTPHVSICMILVGAAMAAEPSPPKFTRKPMARQAGQQVRIEFAVDRKIDVAVYIQDAAGKVIRHLAAGVLGEDPPAPLAPNSLSQSILWDMNDDAGKPAVGEPFGVRVVAGMKPRLDGFLLDNPDGLNTIHSLAVGPKGNVYVFYNTPSMLTGGGIKIKLLSRRGRHVRALLPFPADIAPEKVRSLGVFRTEEGDLVPRIHGYHQCSFYPLPGAVARDRSASVPSGHGFPFRDETRIKERRPEMCCGKRSAKGQKS